MGVGTGVCVHVCVRAFTEHKCLLSALPEELSFNFPLFFLLYEPTDLGFFSVADVFTQPLVAMETRAGCKRCECFSFCALIFSSHDLDLFFFFFWEFTDKWSSE